ncbi:MAG: phosphoribosylformylglycinamidine synthase I [Candidatus Lokiarchaeota archaeon]|nr:phosphoribosylformylglycinamidine synthase I [Candidatus Lokiarchaeota archaeon]
MKIAVIQFPGSNCDLDTVHVLNNVIEGIDAELVWHNQFKESKYDGAVLPGGFSFGDYLRSGIIAAHSPALDEAENMLKEKKPVIGICNGFQILAEAQFLPGALLKNDSLKFICKWVKIRVENTHTAFTNKFNKNDQVDIPIAHGEGRYFTDNLKELEDNNLIVLRYVNGENDPTEKANPNGSMDNIAGVCNLERNCLGLMPHPERASERILSPYGNAHGKVFFQSMVNFLKNGGL